MAQITFKSKFDSLVEELKKCEESNVKILKKAFKTLQEAHNKGNVEEVKSSANYMRIQTLEVGLKLSREASDFLQILESDGSLVSDNTTKHVTQVQVLGKTENAADASQRDGQIDIKHQDNGSSSKISASSEKQPFSQSVTSGQNKQEITSKKFSQTYGVTGGRGTVPGLDTVVQDDLARREKLITELNSKVETQNMEMETLKEEHKKCKDTLKNTEEQLSQATAEISKMDKKLKKTHQNNSDMSNKIETLEQQQAQLIVELDERNGNNKELRKKLKATEESAARKFKDDQINYDALKKEHQELKDRFSKVAGAKLQDGNPDITDLSDPNRAMKLEGRFSALYDDEWTDAFQAQTDTLKRSTKDAIKSLLNVLTVCYEFCKDLAEQQMDSLRMVFLHPCQDLCQTAMANKERPRIASKEDKILKDLRKQIGTQSTHEVKQQFLAKMAKSYNKAEDSKKVMGASKAYFEKCAEVCWMMVLHDPPLYMDTSIQTGDKINLNFYRVYSSQGEIADFLVWPTLHITGGGLLAKGVVEPISKKKK